MRWQRRRRGGRGERETVGTVTRRCAGKYTFGGSGRSEASDEVGDRFQRWLMVASRVEMRTGEGSEAPKLTDRKCTRGAKDDDNDGPEGRRGRKSA
jgi:hypothetical protein